jgi:SpoVK/Ycf46/Vps4 family AAA+-type ATPase
MSKKTRPIMNEQQHKPAKKARSRSQLPEAPPINSLHDLVEIGHSIQLYRNIDSVMIWRITPYLEQLNNLIGMEELKKSIFYQVLYYIQGMHKRNSEEYLHTMIYGSPGIGKTTVAQLIAKIYQALGILSKRGHFRIAHRDDFIAGYLGQTAIKTEKLLKSCLGGVLFIDEVYSLAPRDNDRDSFSKEALDTLTAFLSEHKNDFCCIGAGYENDIEDCFFGMNQGLKRRFPWVHRIDKYNPNQLAQIFFKMVKEINWETAVDLKTVEKIIQHNMELFENAGGDIETFITKCKITHAKRVISLGPEHKFVLTKEDLEEAIEIVKYNKKQKDNKPPFGLYM